jgi:hypothetical protein
MKRITLLAAAFALTSGFALAQDVVDSTVAKLTSDGFSQIEVKRTDTLAKIEANNGSQKVEITIDLGTGEVVKTETRNLSSSSSSESSSDDSSDDDGQGSDDNGSDDNGSDDNGGDDSDNGGSGDSGGSGDGGSGSDD